VTNEHVAHVEDLNGREFVMMAVLAVAVLALGLWPAPLLEVMKPSVEHLLQQIMTSKL
jgi:NADH-quinone oxidoreductase subunit M